MKKNIKRKKFFDKLWEHLDGNDPYPQIIIGPRQIGKTTIAKQIFDKWEGEKIFETADIPITPNRSWIEENWIKARKLTKKGKQPVLLVLDEIQKIFGWSSAVKYLFDEDNYDKRPLKVLILGSSSLLMGKGLSESLAGRFFLHRHFQWSYKEIKNVFNFSLKRYILYGGYPGSFIFDPKDKYENWVNYIENTLIEPVLNKDIILMESIEKPALLRQLFGLALKFPAQILSFNKMLGHLQEKGNVTTLTSYLELLTKAFLVIGLKQWTSKRLDMKGSIPKFIVMDNSFISCLRENKAHILNIENDKINNETAVFWGHLVENAIGARLYMLKEENRGELFYWRDRDKEIDFILEYAGKIIAVEVKSGDIKEENIKDIEKQMLYFKNINSKNIKIELVCIANNNFYSEHINSISLEEFFSDTIRILSIKKFIIEKYYKEKKIQIENKCLIYDLKNNNEKALKFIYYVIKFGLNITNVEKKLKGLASNKNGKKDRDIENDYWNKLTEFHAFYFLREELKFKVIETDAISPNRKKGTNKNCDFKVEDKDKNEYYFEVKDLSETRNGSDNAEDGKYFFEPKDEEEINKWIKQKIEETIEKGANYLICRVPLWETGEENYFYKKWAKEIFPETKKIPNTDNEWKLPKDFREKNKIHGFFKGFYIIKRIGFLKFSF